MAKYLIQDTTLTEIANAVRAKTGGAESISPNEMASGLNAIAERSSSDLTASGATVTAPAGNYKSQATISVTTATQATPSVSVDSKGLITASATQTAGYVSAGTKSATKQLTTKAAATITPSTSNQTIAAGTYLIGKQTIAGDAELVAENIKKGVNIFGVAGTYDAATATLNFKVVGGTSTPSSPSENTIWINTNQAITSWSFNPIEPNVYDIQPISSTDPWNLISTHPLQEGDVLNFTIPANISSTYEAVRIYDTYNQKMYCIRQGTGAAVNAWTAGIKVAVRISNTTHKINDWSGHGTAYLIAWDAYFHNEGEIWIKTGKNSNVAFNMLKSNTVQIYPNSCQQWIGNAWVSKVAKTYQYGSWVDWWKVIYSSNNSLIGEWVIPTLDGTLSATNTSIDDTGVFSFNVINAGGTGRQAWLYTSQGVDFTDYSKLCWNITRDYHSTADNTGRIHRLYIFGESDYYYNKVAYIDIPYQTTGTYEIDISGLTGSHKLGIFVQCQVGAENHTISFDSIWLK